MNLADALERDLGASLVVVAADLASVSGNTFHCPLSAQGRSMSVWRRLSRKRHLGVCSLGLRSQSASLVV